MKKLNIIRVLLLFCLLTVISGCAILNGGVESSERLTFKDTPEGARLTVPARVFFDKGSSKLYGESIKLIDGLKPILDKVSGDIIVEGHTDTTGSKAYNKKLSKNRANAVKKIIIERHKISPSRMAAKGYGSSRPEVPNAKSIDDLAKNRRAVFLFPDETVKSLDGNKFLQNFKQIFDKASKWAKGVAGNIKNVFNELIKKDEEN